MKGIRESYFDVVEVQDYAQPVLPVANYPVCKDFYPQQNLDYEGSKNNLD